MIGIRGRVVKALALCVALFSAPFAFAQSIAFQQSLAQSLAGDKDLIAFYTARSFAPIWTTGDRTGQKRIEALIAAFDTSDAHGLPLELYNAQTLKSAVRAASNDADLGVLEGKLSRIFLQYARDIQTGIIKPSSVDSEIVRKIPYRGRGATLASFTLADPNAYMRSLPPKTTEYARLMKEKLRFERLVASGGWGPQVPNGKYEPGQSGNGVVALRNRLIAMGFMGRTSSAVFDDGLKAAIQQFQLAHGLNPDGVVGPGTLKEINREPIDRLKSIIVAMERERWMNRPRGARHIWVNLTDFSAKIIDNNKVTFETRSVVGAHLEDQRSPEFSDVMEFMVINPSWYVPRSITVQEYLPLLKNNPNAVSHLNLRDSSGRTVSRAAVDFNSYTEDNFPFSMKQDPSRGNALGLVKFMFPNRYNIYLHDTPSKSLFAREVRAFSHGCIRLSDPFDFAYEMLRPQSGDPVGLFQSILRTGKETRVDLTAPVPVHIVYRTVFTKAAGRTQFRRDVYGRDAKIWNALAREGVALRSVSG